MSRRRRRDRGGAPFLLTPLGIVATTVVIDLIGFGIVLPVLPLWAEEFGASPVEIGAITASYAVMQMLFAPVLGRLSDRHGRRPVILVSLAGTVVAFLMIGFAQGLLVIFIARVLQGIAGASYAAAQAYVADITTPAERARGMGLIGAAFGIGFLLGPALGALFAVIDPRAPFIAAALLALANLAVAYRRLPESIHPGAAPAQRPALGIVRRALASRQLAPLVWLTFIANFAFIGMESTFALFGAHRLGYGMVEMGLLFAYIGLLAALTQALLVRRLVAAAGEARVLVGGLAVTGAGLLLMSPAHGLLLLVVALALVAVGSGLVFATTTALISLASGAGEQGAVLGLAASVGAAARIAGPLVGTALFQHVDLAAPLVVGGVLFLCCALAAARASTRPAVAHSS
jgi:MFS transporter, DHA1 family, tetracycline resistance protein